MQVLSAGAMRWYDLIVQPRRSGEAIVGLLCTATDITEHKRTEAALTEANRRKREFLAVLGHELRNPLASIEHGVQLLASIEGDAERPRTRAAIDALPRQVEHLRRLADDLLDISRIDQNKIEIRRERVDVGLALRDGLEAVRPQIEEKGQQFEASLPPEPMIVAGDRTRIAQIIANLVGNAIKYTGPDGVIRVDLETQDQNAVLTVRDSGVGIAPEVLPRVFDLFMQADRTDQRGLGIGLALAKTLIELHGGSIEADSPGLGLGSTFIVRLPLVQASADAAVTGSVSSAQTEASVRVLIIDDNRDVADSLVMLLHSFDLAAEAAYDGLSGVEAARRFQPDLALIDIRMPTIDGYEAARRIRALPLGRRPTLVALSGLGQDNEKKLAEAGFDLQLVKPIGPEEITALIAQQVR